MNELRELISGGENERLEFKESLRLKEEISQAVSAFSNANGGLILVGVSDSGNAIGIDIGRNTLEELAKESGAKVYWDELVCEDAKVEDIDEEKVKWFLKEARKQRGLNLSDDAPIEEVLMKLKLLRNGKLTNAALLLFSEEQMFLQSEIKCIRFSRNEPIKPYIDFQTIEGTVFDLIDKAEDFVLRNIRKSIWLVSGKVQREEKYEYH